MEHVTYLDDPAAFDRFVHEGLPEGQDLTLAIKARATAGGRPAVVLTWTVRLPDGSTARAQAVTTAGAFLALAAAVRGFVDRNPPPPPPLGPNPDRLDLDP